MRKLFSFILLALLPVVASAYDAEVNGVFYNFSEDEATVTFMKYDEGGNPMIISGYTGSVTIPSSVTFDGKTYVVTSINTYTFYRSSVISVTIPESVKSIGEGAFEACRNLVSITIPGSVAGIGRNAFLDCSGLTSIILGDGLTSIGNSAFRNCYSLTSVDIPSSVARIEDNAFESCKGLTDVTIPGCVASIGSKAFSGCTGLTSLTIGVGVTNISQLAFSGCTGLPSVTIPESVTSIGNYAFYNCTSLTSVSVPESITEIGGDVFYNTPWFDKQPDGIIYLGRVAYKYKGEMPEGSEISIKEGTVRIAAEAFNECLGLTSITIPDGVTVISTKAFFGCKNLASVSLPESVTQMSQGAFTACRSLTSITIPKGVTNIDQGVFSGCGSLTSIVIPDGVKKIDDEAFSDCVSLHSVIIPASVTSIGRWAFVGCRSLTSVVIPGVTSISYAAFSLCTGLKSVTIGDSVNFVDKFSFDTCTSLTDVFCLAETIPITEKKAFEDSPIGVATLHVPAESVEKYQKTSPWKNFGSIVALSNVDWQEEPIFTENKTFKVDNGCATITYQSRIGHDFESALDSLIKKYEPLLTILETEGHYSGEGLNIDKEKINVDFNYDSRDFRLLTFTDKVNKYRILFSSDVIDEKGNHYYYSVCNDEAPVTYTEGQMATIILPTEPDASKGRYYRLDRCEGNKIIFVQELQPQARIPYIIIPNQDFSVEVKESELEGQSTESVSIDGISFLGTFQRIEISCPEGCYIDIIDTTPDCCLSPIGETGKKAIIGALRGYLIVPWDDPYNPGGTKGPQEKKEIVLKDDPDGSLTPGPSPRRGEIYDLSGRKIVNGKLPQGIYIQNGRKYVK